MAIIILNLTMVALLECRLSGLIVDVFGDIAVVASSAAWVEKYRPAVESSIGRINAISHINWRPSIDILKEEGLNVSNLKNFKACSHLEKVKVRIRYLEDLHELILCLLHFQCICNFVKLQLPLLSACIYSVNVA